MNRASNLPGVGLLTLTLAAGLTGCGGEPPAAAPQLRPVRTVIVERTDGGVSRTLAGVARAGVESRLSFRVAGTVESVDVELGDRVRNRQVLARLDPTDYELQVEEAEAGLAQAQAGRARRGRLRARPRSVREQQRLARAISTPPAPASSRRGPAGVGRQEARAGPAAAQLHRLRAPIDGAIAAVPVEVNENVRAGQPVVLLTSGAEPEVEVAMPEVFISQIPEGQPVEVSFDALPGRRLAARVTEVGVAATGTATTFPVVADLSEAAPDVRSGMAAEVTFRFAGDRRRTASWCPAWRRRGPRRTLRLRPRARRRRHRRWRAGARSRSASRPRGGRHRDPRGLTDGERVVTAGVRRLTDGRR